MARAAISSAKASQIKALIMKLFCFFHKDPNIPILPFHIHLYIIIFVFT